MVLGFILGLGICVERLGLGFRDEGLWFRSVGLPDPIHCCWYLAGSEVSQNTFTHRSVQIRMSLLKGQVLYSLYYSKCLSTSFPPDHGLFDGYRVTAQDSLDWFEVDLKARRASLFRLICVMLF